MRVPNTWRPVLRLGIPRERLSIPPGTRWGGKDTGWLATWECPLRTDSTSSKSLESFIQLISFSNSWILVVSSKIVSSTNLLIEIVSNVEPWNRFNSSISLRLSIWSSRSCRFCFNYCSWISCWSRRNCSSLISSRWDPITPFNFLITSSVTIGLELVFLNLCFTISENLVFLSSPFLQDRQTTTDLTPNFLQESDKLVYGPLVLLAEWTVVKRALCRWCCHWSPSHACRYEGLVSLEDSWMKNFSCLWEVVVVEVGLITCERSVVDQRARLLIRGSAQEVQLRTDPHRRWSEKSGGWSRRWERQMKSAKRGSKREIKNTGAWNMDGMTRTNNLSQCRVRQYYTCAETRENVTCEVFCSQFFLMTYLGTDMASYRSLLVCRSLSDCCLHLPHTCSTWRRLASIGRSLGTASLRKLHTTQNIPYCRGWWLILSTFDNKD